MWPKQLAIATGRRVTVCRRLRASLCGMSQPPDSWIRIARGVLVAGTVLLAPGVVSGQTTAFVGARVIDGKGGVVDRATIIVRDGKIAAIGPAASVQVPDGAQRVDATGATIIPGFINAHGHLTAANGMRNDPAGYTREGLLRQLKTYAQYGVTTVFSLGDDQEAAFQLRNEQSSEPLGRARRMARSGSTSRLIAP